jgi:hypothetical protein
MAEVRSISWDAEVERLSQAIRDELGVTPAVRLASLPVAPRTTFKATRTIDTEGTAAS